MFNSMKNQYQSINEENFFKNLQYKQEYEVALSNDLLLSENDNEDEIYLVRVEYDEYIIGRGNDESNEIHVMNLCEALQTNLRDVGLERDVTLLQWLRGRDYQGVKYDQNYDLKKYGKR